ncbi:MAG: type II toxin-antitoxin system VapC family toxin [Alphaproteobacteria bacterium]|nr:MAG: type II toxin-antitoxin system VapC family toxin [Alphaproteobacteria bacterium]
MALVIDSSLTLAWIYLDELTPATLELSESISETGAWVPSIWRLEVANSLHVNIRRRRIDRAFRDRAIEDLSRLTISVDAATDELAWTATLALSDQFGLTMYDACYLELAQRRALPLATLDKDLRKAAKALGILLLGV